jgi:molecular chaperone DnaK
MNKQADEKVAVYDLGGGTFDISILEISDGVLEVLSTAGNTFLGGEDFDRRVVAHLVEQFQSSQDIDLRQDAMALQRLKDAAEKAKCDLSARETVEINLPFIASDADGPQHLSMELTRQQLESLVGGVVQGTLKTVDQCVQDAGLSAEEIDQVLLVGGQSRMPLVQQAVADYFGKRPHKGVNPDEVVATGAAIQAETLVSDDDSVLLLDVTPLSLGIATFGGHFAKLIERNTTVPVCKSHVFTTTRDNQSAVKIRVLQGEADVAVENDLLGEFVLGGIRPARKGEPEIEVSFDIDANGIVSASARDTATGKEQSITVNATGTLSENEIQQIIDENELYEVELKE